jgi:hypothetical protein
MDVEEEEGIPGPAWLSPGWRKFWTIVLGSIFFLSFLAFMAGIVMRRHLLSPTLYTQALAQNNVYERIYSEALADPAVQQKILEATGLDVRPVAGDLVVGEVFAQVVSAAYLILPPSEMQAGAETFFGGLTAYLAGDTPQLEEDLNWGAALTPEVLAERLVKAATAVAAGTIDKATPILERGTEALVESELTAYLDQISQGRLGPIPARLLRTTVRGIARTDSERLTNLLLGPAADTASDDTRLQIQAALAADDLTSAITLAAAERLTLRVTTAIAAAEPKLAETQALVGISGAAKAIGQTRDQVVGGLNTVRSLIARFEAALIPLTILMIVALLLIVWLNSYDLRSAFRSIGWTVGGSAAIVMVVWFIAGLFLRSYLRTALAGQFGFAGLDGIIDDVVGSLVAGIWTSVWRTALLFLLIGLVALIVGYSQRLMRGLRRLLAPVWAYKWWVLAGVAALFLLVPLVLNLVTDDAGAATLPCNGFVELCDRPANEVAYATSHNSMSIAEYGWIWPMHDGTVTDQLNAGVRSLLIDTHYRDNEEQVQEYLATLTPEERAVAEQKIAQMQAANLIGTYLCHQFCGFGYTPLSDTLTEIRTWLDDNPREVLFIVIQDEITPADTEKLVTETGLLPFIYDHPQGEPWPTLREMIDSNKRLVVMAENEGPPPDWYSNVWTTTEETPYTFITKEQFSCKPNRGGTGKDFFLLNHWIQRGSPNRVDAAIVNDYDFLLARARQCEQERGKMPNFVAVNWYGQGDLVDVVNTLNGVEPSQQQAEARAKTGVTGLPWWFWPFLGLLAMVLVVLWILGRQDRQQAPSAPLE